MEEKDQYFLKAVLPSLRTRNFFKALIVHDIVPGNGKATKCNCIIDGDIADSEKKEKLGAKQLNARVLKNDTRKQAARS